ncbi:MAG TPA: TCR/Tet family MFS transporter [Nevskiaceae bacterium]|nr:TCR/Tet family MFS transporter [Nevskiaceae bacterium]
MNSPAPLAGPRRAALVFILVTVAIDILSFGIIIPVLPKLVVDFVGSEADGARMFGWFSMAWATMQFIFSPLLGAISDRYGRRPVILISCFGLGVDFLVMALAPNLAWLFAGRLVSGICAASFSTAGAYIADVTPAEKRATAFGMMGVAFGIGFVVGPFIGGELGALSPRAPFWAAACLALVNACYGVFVLPESLPTERRGGFSWARANPLGSLKLLRSHHELFGFAGVSFLANLAHVVLPSTTVLYMGYRYHWDARDVGRVLGLVGICSAIVQGGLIRPAVKRFGERKAMLFGLACGTVGFMIYGLAPTGTWFLVAIPIMAFWGLAMPSLQSLMTQRVSPTEQGQLQGANSALIGIAGMIGPGLFTQTFAHFIDPVGLQLPGAPYYIASLLLFVGLILAWRITRYAAAAADVATAAAATES